MPALAQQPYDLPLSELEKYKPELTRQPDFDAFWERSLRELAGTPVRYELVPRDYPVRGARLYKILYSGFRGANVQGWLAIPEGDGPFPGLMLFHGYNWAMEGMIHDVVNWALHGYAAMLMLCRGQQGESVDNTVYSHGAHAGWMSKGILSEDEYYYRGVYLDAVRGLEVLASLDQVDRTRIGVTGGSQGGALTLASAALSDIPVVAAADYPYLAHFERAIDITPAGPYHELNEFFRRNGDPAIEARAKRTLSYFDVMNLAPRIRCRTWVSIGLVDTITPPSTVFAAYNHLQCEKSIAVFRYFGHEYIPRAHEEKLRLLMETLRPQ